jgi:hypothetical protein
MIINAPVRSAGPLKGGLESSGLSASDLERRTIRISTDGAGRAAGVRRRTGSAGVVEFTLTAIGIVLAVAMLFGRLSRR